MVQYTCVGVLVIIFKQTFADTFYESFFLLIFY